VGAAVVNSTATTGLPAVPRCDAAGSGPGVRVGIVYYRPPTLAVETFEGGFVAALALLQVAVSLCMLTCVFLMLWPV
jgi:hypothetical protein